MEPEIEQVGDVAVVTIGCDALEASNSEAAGQSLERAIEGKSKVVFDMSGVEFVDSSGLKIFILCLKRLRAAGGDLKLCAMTTQVRQLFELVRLHRIMDIFDTRDDALKDFRK